MWQESRFLWESRVNINKQPERNSCPKVWNSAQRGGVTRRPKSNPCKMALIFTISGSPAQAVILKCDFNPEPTRPDPASDGLPPILYSMACHRLGASLVACRADPCGRPVDRPIDNRGAHPAPLAGMDSPHAVSRTLQFHSAQPNLG